MKKIFAISILLLLVVTNCEDNSNDTNQTEDIKKHSTLNVKTGSEYFSFATNSGSTNSASNYDIEFYSVFWRPAPSAPEIYDPRFRSNDGIDIAVIKNTKSLDDVTEIPDSDKFMSSFSTEFDLWFYTTAANIVVPFDYVYVVNTADGKFPVFEITNYYDDDGNSGVFSIEWKYLSN